MQPLFDDLSAGVQQQAARRLARKPSVNLLLFSERCKCVELSVKE
jgi:hypothetical protein